MLFDVVLVLVLVASFLGGGSEHLGLCAPHLSWTVLTIYMINICLVFLFIVCMRTQIQPNLTGHISMYIVPKFYASTNLSLQI